MDNSPIQIRVTTRALRNLLDQAPEAQVALEALAAEKIAEELKRKVIAERENEIIAAVKHGVERSVLRAPEHYRDSVKLGETALGLVNKAVDAAIQEKVLERTIAIQEEIERRVAETLEFRLGKQVDMAIAKIQAWWEERAKALTADVKKQARNEFLEVVERVAGMRRLDPAGGPIDSK